MDENTVLLAIDDHLLPFRRDLCYYVSKPTVRAEAVLAPSVDDPNAPDHQTAHFYGTVLYDGGKYRMWYYGNSDLKGGGGACYAESDDGIEWTKPGLGQVESKGSRDHNKLALAGGKLYGISVIKDEDDSDPQRRYKMMYEHTPDFGRGLDRYKRPRLTLRTATSPDGIAWTSGDDFPIDDHCEHGSFYKHGGLYVAHGHGTSYGEGGGFQGRQGLAWVSPDFDEWVQGFANAFLLPEPADNSRRGYTFEYDQVHLGVGPVSLGNVCVGVATIWREKGWGERGIRAREGGGPGNETSCDFCLVVSNDGIHFREPVKGHVFLSSEESPGPPVESTHFGDPISYPTILCQGNGIVNVGEETRLYHGRWRNVAYSQQPWAREHYWGETALATLPRDRWGALGLAPRLSEGWVWSSPLMLPEKGCQISLNADHAQLMDVEVSDENFRLLPEYSGANAGTAAGDGGLDTTVTWTGGGIAALQGKTVRLRINMKRAGASDPRLYAVYVRP